VPNAGERMQALVISAGRFVSLAVVVLPPPARWGGRGSASPLGRAKAERG